MDEPRRPTTGPSRLRIALGHALRGPVRAGLIPHAVVLTVTGRKRGEPRSTPITPIEVGGRHWLVSPYGTVEWVKNLRADPEATLARRRTVRRFIAREASAAEAGPVLKRYVAIVPIARPYFSAGPQDPAGAFAAEADRHPVFEVIDPGALDAD
ncbi:nitroreductase family deazaflavin-dependent oxidoreductase [Agromyces sp. LHK192]|uniref:nitroreductase family deazaflavin-dependent oxidoreductase n=1 Tax=Agromyces sp. LHK192 TaxID=2498704 RepID=UPI000FDC33D1|nr:nitroreductase family deazaflavin-dependent oxidoreductase [Agromyces sp. LHK192]